MSSSVYRSSSRSSAATAAAGSRGLSATASAGFGSCGLSATASAGFGSRNLSASAPKSPAETGSRGPSATSPGLFSVPESDSISLSTPSTGLECGKTYSTTSPFSISPFTQPEHEKESRAESPDTISTASFHDVPLDSLQVDLVDTLARASYVDVVKKVDEVIGKLQVEEDNVVLEMMNTCRWENIDGANFMRYLDEGKQKKFYIRPCYQDVYQILHDTWKGEKPRYEEPQHCVLITGTPGIGKSVFGKILCAAISQRAKPTLIFYQGVHASSSTLFWQGQAYLMETERKSRKVLSELLRMRVCSTSHDDDQIEIWSIGDTSLPFEDWHINRICITSPGHARIGNFSMKLKQWVKNNHALTLAIPPCTWDEILHIRLSCFGDLAEKECPIDTLQQAFDLWGGIPRTLMYDQSLDASHADSEFNKWKVADAIRYLGNYDLDHDQHSGKIFHLYPYFQTLTKEETHQLTLKNRYNAKKAKYYWASEILERKAWRHFRRQQEAEVIEYISTLNNDPAARGKPWEEHIHQLIETSGLEGILRNLETDEQRQFILRPRFTSFFDEFDDIDDSAQYWRPTSRKYPTCDGYIPEQGIMLQMTVGEEHTVNMEGLEKVMNSGIFREWENEHPAEKLKLIFVVDSAVYSEYERKQTFRYPRSEKNANNKRKIKGKKRTWNHR